MDFKKKLQNFWRLNAQSAKGFTLVELIVVIAILAILAGVAVPAYSGYVEKAKKQADLTLVSEVSNALTMHYYNTGANAGGFVVISREGVPVPEDERADDFGVEAMKAAFGEGWIGNVILKHDWNANLSNATATNIAPEQILGTTSSLTDIASAIVGGQKSNSGATQTICALLNGDETMRQELQQYENDPAYATIASNLIVKYVSDELGNMTGESEPSEVGNIAMMYTMFYSMANSDDPYADVAGAKVEAFEQALGELAQKEKDDPTGTSVSQELYAILTEMLADDELEDENGNTIAFGAALENYRAQNMDDIEGISDAMQFVSGIAQGYSDAASLANKDLYATEGVEKLLKDYQNANKYGVVVRIDAQGTITILPTEASLVD